MTPSPETIRQAVKRLGLNEPRNLGVHIARELEAESFRIEASEAEQRRGRGVSFGGLAVEAYRPRTCAEIAEAAHDKATRAAQFAASPRGLFIAAINAIASGGGYLEEAERARAAYWRGFSDPNREPSHAEIGVALLALNEVNGKDAIMARAALAELLFGPARVAA